MTNRREFLQRGAAAGLLLSLPELLLADPYRPWTAVRPVVRPVRLRGRVTAGGRGVAGARVTDGRQVVRVDADGRFDFASTDTQRWLSVCPPRGFELPVGPKGTLQLHAPIGVGSEVVHEFQLTPRAQSDERHAMLVLADPQTQDAHEMQRMHGETVPDVIATRRAIGNDLPVFGVTCGDIMFDDLALYPEYERAVTRMGIPFAQVVGNHDLDQGAGTTEGSVQTFERHFGPSHYSFDVGAVHYQVLNDVFWHGAGYLGYLTEEQLAWVAADLAFVEPGRRVVVLTHIPLESTQYLRNDEARPAPGVSMTNREALQRLYERHRVHIVAGHTHESEHRIGGKIHEHVAGAVCGAWWSGDICHDGTPNGYAVYEMSGEEVRWRYKATGQDASHQLRLYAPGADPTAAGDLVANAWDWDPSWVVRWFEDGESRGLMSQRRGLDPMAVKLHRGPDLPARRPWVDPIRTNHLFFAAASPTARSWRVEAVDGVGRRYQAELRRS